MLINNKYQFRIYNSKEGDEYYDVCSKYPNLDFNPFKLEYENKIYTYNLSRLPISYIEYYKYDEFIFNGPGFVLKINGLIKNYYNAELFINKKSFIDYSNLSNYIGKYTIKINFYNKNNKLIEEFKAKISPILKIYESYDKRRSIIQINMSGRGNHTMCCCGYTSNKPYQNLLLFAGNNISNLIYKTHDRIDMKKFRIKPIGYLSFIKDDTIEKWIFNNS